MLGRLLARLTGRRVALGGKALGAAGERLAAKHLKRNGYTVLARNVIVPAGEADIVCAAPDGRTLVMVEVKTRAVAPGSVDHVPPEAAVHAHKREKLLQVARQLVRRPGWRGYSFRIDVIAVEWCPCGDHVVRHHVGAVGER